MRTAKYRMSNADKKVVDAFVSQEAAHSNLLLTDGKSLHKMGMGREKMAVWRGRHIAIVSTESVKSDEVILRYLVKTAGKSRVRFDHKRPGHEQTLRFTYDIDGGYGGQMDGYIGAYIPGEDKPVGALAFTIYQGEYSINMVRVLPEYRRSGIATAMYKYLFKHDRITKRDLKPSLLTDDGAAFRATLASRVIAAYRRKDTMT